MCGRYSFVPTEFQLKQDLGELEKPPELEISYNIAPTQQGYVITNDEPGLLPEIRSTATIGPEKLSRMFRL